jgi:hypothetical protein
LPTSQASKLTEEQIPEEKEIWDDASD